MRPVLVVTTWSTDCMVSIGYIPGSYGHYVENIGDTPLRFLEIFKTDTFQDVSLSQVYTSLQPRTFL